MRVGAAPDTGIGPAFRRGPGGGDFRCRTEDPAAAVEQGWECRDQRAGLALTRGWETVPSAGGASQIDPLGVIERTPSGSA